MKLFCTICLLIILNSPVIGQVQIWAAKSYTKQQLDSVYRTGSGISSPGKAVVGAGFGGHVGNWNLDATVSEQNKSPYANGSVITRGLIPNIKPIWDKHMLDAVIILSGDGNYYLTGSTGNNIWHYNDGVEIYCSKDLKKWDYLGLVWSIEKDGRWKKNWRNHHSAPTRAVCAPELNCIHHNYYMCLSMPPDGISI